MKQEVNFNYSPITGLVSWSFINETAIDYDYSRDKGRTVTFGSGKEPIKLRQLIASKAKYLSKVSNGNYTTLRKIFVEAYNAGGIEAVDVIYKESLLRIYKSLN